MPQVLIAFFLLSGLLHGGTVVGSLKGVDPHSNPKNVGKLDYEYTIRTSAQRAFAKEDVYGNKICDIAAFAITPGGKRMRMRINGVEQGVDWSWAHHGRLKVDHQGDVRFEFIDPVTGKVVAVRERTFQCYDEIRLREELTKEGWIL